MPTGQHMKQPEHRKRVGLQNKGKFKDRVNSWKGDEAGYHAKHLWLTAHYDKTSCEECGITGKRLEWANISGEYRREREDYRVLCTSCHKRFDDQSGTCRGGHDTTVSGAAYGNGACKICAASYREARREEKRLYDKERRKMRKG